MIDQALIDVARAGFTGKRLAKLDASLAVLQESLEQGAWVPRGSVKANAGFYQGLKHVRYRQTDYQGSKAAAEKDAWHLHMTLCFGYPFQGKSLARGLELLRLDLEAGPKLRKISDDVIVAWAALCLVKSLAIADLDQARPKPVLTPIGLSPKVTKTLTEMNLEIDLPSIRPATLERRQRPRRDAKGQVMKLCNGEIMMESYYVVVWSPGIRHGESRFATGGGCEACGKYIPSGRFVPIEAKDKRSGSLISLWLGCDCARNIFGIKDDGVEKT